MRKEIQKVPHLAFKGLLCASWRTFYPVRKTLAEKKGVIMKRAMALVVVMAVLVFSQLALAQLQFRIGEPVLTEVGEVQDQAAAAAAGFKITPLQAFTVRTSDGYPQASWQFNEEYYFRALFVASGTGTYYTRIKVTDVPTGQSIRFPKEGPYVTSGGTLTQTSTTLSVGPLSGVPTPLPRQFILTYEFKVGTTWKGVSTKIWLY
jgi:hypothetical protein